MREIKGREMYTCPEMGGRYVSIEKCNSCPHFSHYKWGRVFCKYDEWIKINKKETLKVAL